MGKSRLDGADSPGSANFPETATDFVARLEHPDHRGRREAIEHLAARYWAPVYCFVRTARSAGHERASDITQSFFAWLLERDVLERYRRERGSFRSYLKALVRGFLANEQRSMQRLKRGADVRFVSFDRDMSPSGVVDPSQLSNPERAFDEAWSLVVMREAVRRVKQTFAADDRMGTFRVFEAHDLDEGAAGASYGETATRLGLKESQVRNALATVRRAVRTEIKAEIKRLTTTPEQFDQEWTLFLRNLGHR